MMQDAENAIKVNMDSSDIDEAIKKANQLKALLLEVNELVTPLKANIKLDEEEKRKITKCLWDFVKRVSKGDTTSDTEVQVLPEVAQVLVNLNCG
jgi:predicted  nucleic acid-binding Zn-ribbon protein